MRAKKEKPPLYKISKSNIAKLIKKNQQGIKLDCGCGSAKQKGYVGLDIRALKDVDIVHDVESVPYPLPDDCCFQILCSHLIEHLKPWLIIDIFNEWWRIMKPGGQLLISTPYAGSFGFWQDPTHIKGYNQASFTYFDPREFLYSIYRSKPWKIERNAWWENGNMEVIMSKLTIEEGKNFENARLEAEKARGISYGNPD